MTSTVTVRRPLLAAAAAIAALAATFALGGEATAQVGGTHRHKLLGKEHEFAVPVGWTASNADNTVNFNPPAGRMRGDFGCFVAGFEGDVGGRSPVQFAKDVAATHKKDHMPFASITEPSELEFMGRPAALITVGGMNPQTKQNEAAMFLLAPGDGFIYAFVAAGRLDDLQDNSGDLVTIVNGVVPVKAGQPKPPPGGGGGDKGCVGFGCGSGAPPMVSDPSWGLEIAGLGDAWRVKTRKDYYVFSNTKSAGEIAVKHTWVDAPDFKAAKARGKASKVGTADALVVDEKGKRTWYLERGKLVTIVELSAADPAAAEKALLPEFGKAFFLLRKDFTHRNDGKKGVRASLANDVSLELPAGWFFNDVNATGATFGTKEGRGFVLVQARTASTAKGADPFFNEFDAVKFRCKALKGDPKVDETQIAGFGKTRRLRCQRGKDSDKALMPWFVLVLEGKGVHIFLFGTSTDAKLNPDNRVTELAGFVVPPR